MKLSLIILSLLISLAGGAQVYLYSDGSSNSYLVTPEKIAYTPVKKESSSSGAYSGGEEKSVKLTAKQFEKLKSFFEEALKQPGFQNSKREMGTGLIHKSDKSGKEVVLPSEAPLKEKIETYLKQLVR